MKWSLILATSIICLSSFAEDRILPPPTEHITGDVFSSIIRHRHTYWEDDLHEDWSIDDEYRYRFIRGSGRLVPRKAYWKETFRSSQGSGTRLQDIDIENVNDITQAENYDELRGELYYVYATDLYVAVYYPGNPPPDDYDYDSANKFNHRYNPYYDPSDRFSPYWPPDNLKYTVSTSHTPSAGGTTSGGGQYDYGSVCTISATPSAGYGFKEWRGHGSLRVQGQSVSFYVVNNQKWKAVFTNDLNLVLASVEDGMEQYATTSGTGTYATDTTATISATSTYQGVRFLNWTDDDNHSSIVTTNQTITFNVTEPVSYTAHFTNEWNEVRVEANLPNVSVLTIENFDKQTSSSEGTLKAATGDLIGIKAYDTPNVRFVRWEWMDGGTLMVHSNRVYGISMPSRNVDFTARFAMKTGLPQCNKAGSIIKDQSGGIVGDFDEMQ